MFHCYKKLYLCAGKALIYPGPTSSDILYLQDEYQSAKIDANWVIFIFKFKVEYYNSEHALFLLIIFFFL